MLPLSYHRCCFFQHREGISGLLCSEQWLNLTKRNTLRCVSSNLGHWRVLVFFCSLFRLTLRSVFVAHKKVHVWFLGFFVSC